MHGSIPCSAAGCSLSFCDCFHPIRAQHGRSRLGRFGHRGVLLISTETLSEPKLATARSSTPSPLKSPTATEVGSQPAPKFRAASEVPSPLPSSTETLLER